MQVADYRPGDTFGPRRLVDYEFVWILSGSAVWTVQDGGPATDHALTPGSLSLARAGAVDSYQWDERQPSRHAYVHFRITDCGELPEESEWPAVRILSGSPILEGICGYLLELAGQQSQQARSRSDQVLGLLLDVFVTGPLHEPFTALTPHLAAVAEYVRTRWESDGLRIIGVDELCTAGNLSAGHLFRLFRQHYGCGPARALELVRLARAATSLQRSNATIAEVARLTGFANPYHFSRRFSAVYGIPPGAFRALTASPDPLRPVREAGLLPMAHVLLHQA
ncbi:MAG: AraC family transcriptional regulator [Frankiales bacterium]|nr:AraC family transcriptional regulator [Frankiales bacterium]